MVAASGVEDELGADEMPFCSCSEISSSSSATSLQASYVSLLGEGGGELISRQAGVEDLYSGLYMPPRSPREATA